MYFLLSALFPFGSGAFLLYEGAKRRLSGMIPRRKNSCLRLPAPNHPNEQSKDAVAPNLHRFVSGFRLCHAVA
ncbi:hypothetical protein HMPREF1554_00305 [Porphyromonas gingivalis F0569]|nr:hypothetical protein HMPREF1554_00305 [Porphyromonas gingivalis F0569]